MSRTEIKNSHQIPNKFWVISVCFFSLNIAHASNLEEAIDRALKIDPTVRASKFNLQAAEEGITIAKSRFFPQITLQGSSNQLTQTTSQDIPFGVSTSKSFSGPSTNHQLIMRQTIIRPKDLSSLRYAELQAQYMELKYKYEVAELKSRVINAWIDLLVAKKIEQIYKRPLDIMKVAVLQERAKFENGDGTKDGFMEVEAQFENAKAIHFQSAEIFMQKKNAFERITELSFNIMDEKFFSPKTMAILELINKEDYWHKYKEESLDLQMMKIQEFMQLERINMIEADHKPILDMTVALNFAKNDATSTQGYQYKNKQIGLQYILPIYSGGAVSSSTKQMLYMYEASLMESHAANIRLQNDFNINWSQLTGAIVKEQVQHKLLTSSAEQLISSNRAYQLGLKTIGDVAINQNNMTRKEVDFVNSIQDSLRLLLKLRLFNYIDVYF